MTKNKGFKTAARRRMAVTGETYTVAREAILAERAKEAEAELAHGTPPVSAPLFREPTKFLREPVQYVREEDMPPQPRGPRADFVIYDEVPTFQEPTP